MNILNIKTKEEFYNWLLNNHDIEKECYISLKRGEPKDDNIFYYIDAVYVALCFGWIDSTLSKIDGISYQRFSKRSNNSNWTELNKQRVRYLLSKKMMHQSGIDVLPNMDKALFKIDDDIAKDMKDAGVYDIFLKMDPLYIRIRANNLSFYKKLDEKQYKTALENFIKNTKQGKYYGSWNDYGRLSDAL